MDPEPDADDRSLAQRRRAFLDGLRWSVFIYAVLTCLLWGVGYGSWRAAGLSFVAPPVFAVHAMRRGDAGTTLVCSAVTLVAGVLAWLGALRPRPALTRNAHFALGLYWLVSFALMSIGV